jgi:aspartate racemase
MKQNIRRNRMKRLGIVGGLGPEATIDYYRMLNRLYEERNGKTDYPELIVYSVNLKKLMRAFQNDALDEATDYLTMAIESLATAGADFAIIASNTPHALFDELNKRTPIPLISIVEKTMQEAQRLELKSLALLGTRYTMTHDFYQSVFERGGIDLAVPGADEIVYIHGRIMTELERGIVNPQTRENILDIIKRMKEEQGAGGVILGCTELPLMFPEDELGIPFLNTSLIHVKSALAFMS